MRPASGLGTVAAVVVSAALLLLVAIVNGGPVVYPDSAAYLIDGDRIARLTAPYAVRPVFYGIALKLLHWREDFWPELAVQALILAHLLFLTLRAVGARLGPAGFVAVVLGLVVLTPVAWHAAHLLPDIFVAMLVLATVLLGFCADRLGRWERAYLVLLAAVATSFHVTALPLALVLVALVATVRLAGAWGRARPLWAHPLWAHPLWAGLPVVLALLGALGFNALVWNRLTLTPNSPPSLLARVLADGPGRDYLTARCPEADFELCRYLDRLPDTEDGFMWRLLPSLPVADGKRIKAEAGAVVEGTVRMFPGRVLGHMIVNGLRQLVTIGSETQLSDAEWAEFQAEGSPLARATSATLQAHRALERPALNGINAVHAGVVVLSLAAALPLLVLCWRGGATRAAALLLSVLLALAANAFVTGALGGVFARYEGRVVWLLPFAVVAAALAIRRSGAP